MSMIRPMTWLAAVVAACSIGGKALAQGMPIGPDVGTQMSATAGHETFWNFQPFIDPGYFNPDFQFFAPPEVSDFGGGEEPNHGLYFSFDRTYVNVSRPRDEFSFGSGNQGDFTWGNRIEVGYMMGDPKGWQAVLWHVNGPNEYAVNTEFQQQIDVAGPPAATTVILSPGGQDSLNVLKMSSFELNRVWRWEEFHNGSILEPFVGFRYMNVRDYFQRQVFNEVAIIIPPVFEFFNVATRKSMFENQMHGGQLGARWFRQRGHWLLSADVKFFAMANFQTLRIEDETSLLPNPDILNTQGTVVDVITGVGADVNRATVYRRYSQFCWGGEVRAEASYELTRDINLRVGMVFLDLGQGIGRGTDVPFRNNQDVQMVGVTFGFTVNR